ncbi:MAG TPA: RHS repeat-associated core domain-containing protein [Terriglobales bacterium]|nr:RHS repeat-associated core domain-containing protein [Terriglobales bacterium]
MKTCAIISIIAFLAVSAFGQTVTGPAPSTSQQSNVFDSVNLGSLNVYFDIPVINKAGRGIPFVYSVTYNSSMWKKVAVGTSVSWQPTTKWMGWSAIKPLPEGYILSKSAQKKCTPDGGGWYYYNEYTLSAYVDRSGVSHPFNLVLDTDFDNECSPYPDWGQASSLDSPALRISATGGWPTAVVTTPEGHILTVPVVSPLQIPAPAAAILRKDDNGNKITTPDGANFIDTLGKTALSISGTNPVLYTYTDPDIISNPNGGPTTQSSVKVYYSSIPIRTYFQCSGVGEYGPINYDLPTSIQLPDGTAYSIAYEASPDPSYPNAKTGRIASITLPTGGVITYNYSGPNAGIVCADGSTSGLVRTTSPGGTWTYQRNLVSGTKWLTTVTDPASNQTLVNFQKVAASEGSTYLETKRVVYSGYSTANPAVVLQTNETCYNNSTPDCTATMVSLPVSSVSSFTRLPNSTGKTSLRTAAFDPSTGAPTDIRVYDFGTAGSGTAGTRLSKTEIGYATFTNGITGKPATVRVFDANDILKAETTYAYDGVPPDASNITVQHDTVSGSRGNLTSVSRSTGTGTLTTTYRYFDTGNLKSVTNGLTPDTDPTTTYTYGACEGAFATQVSLPLSLGTSSAWNCDGGVMMSSTDENNQQTTYTYGDGNRWIATRIDTPDGGQVTTQYNLASSPKHIIQTQKLDATKSTYLQSNIDEFGRVKQTIKTDSGGSAPIFTDTTYDAFSRVATVSNPYMSTSDPTYGLTQYAYDALGRQTTITNPDGTTKTLAYGGSAVTVADEGYNSSGGKVSRTMQYDAAGRLKSVCEITLGIAWNQDSAAPCGMDLTATGFTTTYEYNPLGNLTSVIQGTLPVRAYAYDMLGRLTTESNPEIAGNVSYSYNSRGDLYQRVRRAPNQDGTATVTTTYTYDVLHRLTGIGYSDGTPSRTYTYDQTSAKGLSNLLGKGRLTDASSTSSGTVFSDTVFRYDAVGRVSASASCTPTTCSGGSNTYIGQYSYDLAGNMLSNASPLGGYTLGYAYNASQQLTAVTSTLADSTHPGTLVSNISYNPLGQMISATYGNGITLARSFDNLGRLRTLTDGSVYSIGGPAPNNTVTYYPNSNIRQVIDSSNGSWTYGYDEFNRLASASKGGGDNFTYDYDRYGNRWHQNVNGTSSPSYVFINNRISGSSISYDAAGNITNDGNHTYAYDAENRLISVDNGATATYQYDALGNRIQTTVAGVAREFLYDAQNRMVAMMRSSPRVFDRGEIFAGGWRIATYTWSNTHFNHADWLGNVRVRTDASGAVVSTYNNLPFGDCLDQNGGSACDGQVGYTPVHFTDQDRDTETGLDHFMFRQYASVQGRWMSPDPAGMSAVDAANPQSWNRYAYAGNNPITFVDPLGLRRARFRWSGGGDGYACYIDDHPAACGQAFDLIVSGAAYPETFGGARCFERDGQVWCGNSEDSEPFKLINVVDYFASLPPGLLELWNVDPVKRPTDCRYVDPSSASVETINRNRACGYYDHD